MPEPKIAQTDPTDVHRRFEQYFNSADLGQLVSVYEPDAVLDLGEGKVMKGTEAIREALRGFLTPNARISISAATCTVCGDVALLCSNWRATGTDADGKPIEMAHRSAEVVRRQPDGSWLYVIDSPFAAD